jgi:hypothetical protein
MGRQVRPFDTISAKSKRIPYTDLPLFAVFFVNGLGGIVAVATVCTSFHMQNGFPNRSAFGAHMHIGSFSIRW